MSESYLRSLGHTIDSGIACRARGDFHGNTTARAACGAPLTRQCQRHVRGARRTHMTMPSRCDTDHTTSL